MTGLPTVAKPQFLSIGTPSGPVVIVLGLSAEGTLFGTEAWDGIPYLINAHYQILSLDLPCHGADAPANGEDALLCWAQRLAAGDNNMFLDFCAGLSDILDDLGVKKAAVVGVSRGGYAAITCAAYDNRLVDVALIAPVTDLNYLSEFAPPLEANETLFNTQQYVPDLKERHVLVRIGERDTRVGTDLAYSFGRDVGAIVELLNTTGHYAPEDGSTIEWLQRYPW